MTVIVFPSVPDSDDYVRVNQLLTFGPGGEEVRKVGVAIQDNTLLEGVEVFFGRLLLVTGGVVLVAGGESARVEILDDDGRCSFNYGTLTALGVTINASMD